MRTVHWLFVVGMVSIVTGVGFVIAGARAARLTPASAAAPVALTPIASVKQIMKGVVGPAAESVFNSVSTTVTAAGTENKAPRTDEEWEQVGNSAAALIESGNLLQLGNRAVDTGDWLKMSQALIAAGQVALRATEARNADQLLASGEAINESCDNCHRRYQRGS